jgi:hypothetical protein
MFAMYARPDSHHGRGCAAVWCKSTPFDQDQLIRANPKRFFLPPYVGHQGWLGIRLNGRPNWTTIAELLQTAHRLAAAKRSRGLR